MRYAIRFTHGDRAWYAYKVESEDHKRFITLVKPQNRGPPFPTNAEYRAARAYYHQLTTVPPPDCLRLVE